MLLFTWITFGWTVVLLDANVCSTTLESRNGTIRWDNIHEKNCTLNIHQPDGYIISLNFTVKTSCANKSLIIHDGDEAFSQAIEDFCSRKVLPKFISCSNRLKIQYISLDLKENTGLLLDYTSYKATDAAAQCRPCGGVFYDSIGEISLKLSFNLIRPPEEFCEWRIIRFPGETIKIDFRRFPHTNYPDLLEFIDGLTNQNIKVFNGSSIPDSFIVASHQLIVKYNASRFHVSNGFDNIQFNESMEILLLYTVQSATVTPPLSETTNVNAINASMPLVINTDIGTSNTITPSTQMQITHSSILPPTLSYYKTYLWSHWSSWGPCGNRPLKRLYGNHTRKRICNRMELGLNEANCLVSTIKILNQNMSITECPVNGSRDLPNLAESQHCNLTFSDNQSGNNLDGINATKNACIGIEEETKKCRIAKRCLFQVWNPWTPWSACNNIDASTKVRKRERNCRMMTYVTSSTRKCMLYDLGSSYCSYLPIYNSSNFFPDKKLADDVCDSKCIDNVNGTCKIVAYKPTGGCYGKSVEENVCSYQPTCELATCNGSWANWGECSNHCGHAKRTRFAHCRSSSACDDVLVDSEACSYKPCPVDGQWTEWSPWLNCSRTCGGGLMTRERSCSNPSPRDGGLDCAGITVDVSACGFSRCPVHGGFGPWTTWSYCDQPCNSGKSWRYRQCDSPAPAYGGLNCDGEAVQNVTCNENKCQVASINATLKFTKEKFTSAMLNHESPDFKNFSNKVKSNILQLYMGSSDVVVNVTVHSLSMGSIICYFTIIFSQSAIDELVVFQHAVDDDRILSTMPVKYISITSDNILSAPISIQANSKSATSILVSWSTSGLLKNVTGFMVFYKKFGTTSWRRIGAAPNSTEIVIHMLEEFTLYTIRVSAHTRTGNGIASHYTDCMTNEGVPSSAVTDLTCSSTSSSVLFLKWSHLNATYWHGSYVGYTIRHREHGANNSWQRSMSSDAGSSFYIDKLKPFRRYEVEVAAVTGAGVGPFAWQHCITDEDAPSAAPSQVSAKLVSRDGTIIVSWLSLSDGFTNGVLRGYYVNSLATITESINVVKSINKSIAVSPYSTRAVLTGFKPNTKLELTVSAFTAAGEGPRSAIIFVETCQCPSNIYISWYPHSPYIYGSHDQPAGFVADFVFDALREVCQICDGKSEHQFGSVKIHFNKTRNGKRAVFAHEEELKSKVGDRAQLFLPIYSRSNVEIFQQKYIFLLAAENPGSVLLAKDTGAHGLLYSIESLVSSCWPPFVVVIIIGSVVGILVWTAERRINPTEFNLGSYTRGVMSAFWWGFITLTTVGYGDITPRSSLGKLIAIFWMLVGPVLNSILIGSITTALTTVIISKPIMLYGRTVSVIFNTSEHYLAVRRNAKVNPQVIYRTNSDVISALENGTVETALVDSMSAASMLTRLRSKQIRIAQFIKEPHGFGIVLTTEMIPLKESWQSYINTNKIKIFNEMQNYRKAIENTTDTNIRQTDGLIARMLKTGFSTSVISLSVTIVILSVSIVTIRFIYRRVQQARVHSSKTAELCSIEKELSDTCEEMYLKMEAKFHKLHEKHEYELLKWFSLQRYPFGVLGWIKFGTVRESKIKKRIKMNDIMNGDLNHPQRSTRQSTRTYSNTIYQSTKVESFNLSEISLS